MTQKRPESTWIEFGGPTPSKSGKTSVWEVRQRQEKDAKSMEGRQVSPLGRVGWYGPWRKYVFEPAPSTVFEKTCLRDIAAFCEWATAQHKTDRVALEGK